MGFIKIGKEAHIEALHKRGEVFCNSIEFFRQFDKKDTNRSDTSEGAFKTEFLETENMILSKENEPLFRNIKIAKLNKFHPKSDTDKLYCLFGLKSIHVNDSSLMDQRNLEFGDTALIIFDSLEFIKRIQKSLKIRQMKYEYGFVSYYKEKKINTDLTVFDKPNSFLYQHEFRFCIKDSSVNPLILDIGSIEDISKIVTSTELSEITLEYK